MMPDWYWFLLWLIFLREFLISAETDHNSQFKIKFKDGRGSSWPNLNSDDFLRGKEYEKLNIYFIISGFEDNNRN